jgi:hypothetical protein
MVYSARCGEVGDWRVGVGCPDLDGDGAAERAAVEDVFGALPGDRPSEWLPFQRWGIRARRAPGTDTAPGNQALVMYFGTNINRN